jgi:hypothetical protein
MNYTYTTILPSETIGDSLSAVNNNYLTLENETLNLKLTSDTMWTFMQQYYLEFSPIIKDAINTINSISSSLFQSTTIVQNNSAGWLKPVVVFYPTIFPSTYSNNTILNTVSAWVQQYFPVIPFPTYISDPTTGAITTILASKPTYVENQTLIVYAHEWNINFNPSGITVLTDATTCSTQSQHVCATCSVCYYGGTYCNHDTWVDCGGNCSSCSECADLICYYAAPPYIPLNGNNQYASGQISASVNIQYQDVSELQSVNSFVFTVKDCNWVYTGSVALPSPLNG